MDYDYNKTLNKMFVLAIEEKSIPSKEINFSQRITISATDS